MLYFLPPFIVYRMMSVISYLLFLMSRAFGLHTHTVTVVIKLTNNSL